MGKKKGKEPEAPPKDEVRFIDRGNDILFLCSGFTHITKECYDEAFFKISFKI